ncbi:MAG: hypothetical protein ACRDWD_05960 [Acidimicrobiia bacterium]
MTVKRRGRDRGFVAIELAFGAGLLLIPVAMLVLTVPSWSERQATARAIVREVTRSAAVTGVCDPAAAETIADTMAANLGVDPAEVRLDLQCFPGQRLPRGGEITASVTVRMPAVHIPGVTDVATWRWTARHAEPVDPYRSFE